MVPFGMSASLVTLTRRYIPLGKTAFPVLAHACSRNACPTYVSVPCLRVTNFIFSFPCSRSNVNTQVSRKWHYHTVWFTRHNHVELILCPACREELSSRLYAKRARHLGARGTHASINIGFVLKSVCSVLRTTKGSCAWPQFSIRH